jgi:metaxin
MYLDPLNFEKVARPLYVSSATSNGLSQVVLANQLQSAAQTEILKWTAVIDANELYENAEAALSALSKTLGSDNWIFKTTSPSLLDASIFAYTHPLVDPKLAWQNKKLTQILFKFQNLVDHHDRIFGLYYS